MVRFHGNVVMRQEQTRCDAFNAASFVPAQSRFPTDKFFIGKKRKFDVGNFSPSSFPANIFCGIFRSLEKENDDLARIFPAPRENKNERKYSADELLHGFNYAQCAARKLITR
jgi:hypothetical protein